MNIGKRIYWAAALVAVLALAGAAVTLTSQLTSAGGSTPAPGSQACDAEDEADDALEDAAEEADTDAIEEECGDQNEADDANEPEDAEAEVQVPSGTLDDGQDLLPQAGITIDAAVAAAQTAATGSIGEVDLEHVNGTLVFNVDVGDKDVKVDASNGSIVSVDSDD